MKAAEVLRLLTDGSNLFAIGPKEPVPVIRPAAEKVAMLTDQEMIPILAGVDDFEIIARKEKTLFTVCRVDDMDGPRSGPSRRYEIDQPPIRRELQVIERGDDVFGLLGRARARKAGRLLAVDADLPKLGRLAVLDIATGDRRTVDRPNEGDPFAVGREQRLGVATGSRQLFLGAVCRDENVAAARRYDRLGRERVRKDESGCDDKRDAPHLARDLSWQRQPAPLPSPQAPSPRLRGSS